MDENGDMAIHVFCSHDSIDEHQRSITTNRFFFSSTKVTTRASLRLLSTTIISLLGDPATETSLLPRASTGASLRLLSTTITSLLGDPAAGISLLPQASTGGAGRGGAGGIVCQLIFDDPRAARKGLRC